MTSAKFRVLVVDDSVLICKAMSVLLVDAGYEVKVAISLAEFEELFTNWSPDTILSDIQMGDMRGDELCQLLKSRCDVHVVLFSKLPTIELAAIAERVGADAYITKLQGIDYVRERLDEILQPIIDSRKIH